MAGIFYFQRLATAIDSRMGKQEKIAGS